MRPPPASTATRASGASGPTAGASSPATSASFPPDGARAAVVRTPDHPRDPLLTFFCRLLPPRPTFAMDMTEAEAALMQQHAVYWRGLLERRRAVTFGLVADPAGAHGIAIVEVESAGEVRTLTEHDPTIVADRGFRWEIFPMPFGAEHA